jgi:hypothetical protein
MKRRLQTLGAKVLQEWLVLIAIESADEWENAVLWGNDSHD